MSQNSHDPTNSPRWQWWLALVAGALTLVCGSVGVWQYDEKNAPGVSHGFNPIYHALQMLILHTPLFEKGMNGWIEAGRWFGALTLLITSTALLWKRLRHEFNLIRLTRWSGHHVVCGLGQKGFEIIQCLKRDNPGALVVVIDPQPDFYLAEKCGKLGVCVIRADATQSEVLAQTRVAHAGEVIVITPTDEINVRIANQVQAQLTGQKGKATQIHVHLSDIHLREALQQADETHRQKKLAGALHFFDVFDNEARRVLLALPLDGSGIRGDDRRSVHVVILGFGRMGRSVALRAAKMGHFANGSSVRISIIDRHADEQRDRLLFRYPIFKQKTVCELVFNKAEAESITARDLIEKWAGEKDTLLHVFVCLDDDTRAVEVALRLKCVLQNRADCHLLSRIHSHTSLATIFESASAAGMPIIPFGMVDDSGCEDVIRREHNETLARTIHENFVNQRLGDSIRRPENDPALRPWEELREDLRESNRQQADHIAIKLRAICCKLAPVTDTGDAVTKFTASDVELLARQEHQRWNVERLLAGWRYGTPSNKDRRISENLAGWEELAESIRDYDRKAVEMIPTLLAQAKPPMKVVRDGKPLTV
jgi:Trk K+ transport system NAD-binding subunit